MPQQNGVAKRKNKHLAEACRSMLCKMAKTMKTIAYVINRLPQPNLGFISPFEKLWDKQLAVSYF